MKKEKTANPDRAKEPEFEETFSLESIMQEFGSGGEPPKEPVKVAEAPIKPAKPAVAKPAEPKKENADIDFLNVLKATVEQERAAMGEDSTKEGDNSSFADDPTMQYWLNLDEKKEPEKPEEKSEEDFEQLFQELVQEQKAAPQEVSVALEEKTPETAPELKRGKERKEKKKKTPDAPVEEMPSPTAESFLQESEEKSETKMSEPQAEEAPAIEVSEKTPPQMDASTMAEQPTMRFSAVEAESAPQAGQSTVRFQAVQPEETPYDLPEEQEEPAPKYDGFRRHTAARPRPAPKPTSPEKLYKAAASGLGGSRIRLILAFVAAVFAVGLAVCQAAGWLTFGEGGSSLGFVELALLLLCALFSYDVLSDGISKLLSGRFTLNFLVLLAAALCLIDGVMSLLKGGGTYCAVACVLLASAQWGFFLNRRVRCNTMDVARKMPEAEALVREKNLWNHSDGILCGKADVEEFMEYATAPALPERMLNWYGAFLLVLSGVFAGMYCKGSAETFVHYFTAILLAGIPALTFVMVWRPWAILSKRLHGCGAAIAGWHGVQLLRGKLAVPVSDQDLFPAEKLKMNGTKFFGDCSPELVLSYGASVIEASGSGLAPMFNQQLSARNGRKYPVSKLKRYENGGVGGEIGMDSVLVGTLRFMQSMGVDMPRSTRVSQAVYVAINAEVCGVFAVNYGVTRNTASALSTLTRCPAVTPVLTANDFMLTEAFLRAKFRVDTKHMLFPPIAARRQLDGRMPHEDAPQCALLTRPDFVSTASVITGGRSLYTGAMWGALWAIVSGLFGAGIMAVLASLGAAELMSVGRLLLYMAVWAVPTFLWSMWPQIT